MPHCPQPANLHRRLADVTALVAKAPRTYRELCQLAEVSDGLARRWIKALVDEGLVEQAGGRRERTYGFPSKVWRWKQ